ncbi:MAG TPA: DoxX family protein [Chitinophagaceae bacterium]|jgi:putative oxidoreductase|nr:DoxX family protein [Chitinophagaceae bacterium]
MNSRLLATENHAGYALLRVTLGTVMGAHGLQKAFGLFGGYGWEGTMGYFTGTVGLPAVMGAGIILIESLGAFLLIIGFAGRINAALLGAVMLGAFFVDHLPNGFFMNWFGNQKGEGFEFDLLFVAIAAVLSWYGSGAYSVDRWLVKRTVGARQLAF